jgi:hypothetical protein
MSVVSEERKRRKARKPGQQGLRRERNNWGRVAEEMMGGNKCSANLDYTCTTFLHGWMISKLSAAARPIWHQLISSFDSLPTSWSYGDSQCHPVLRFDTAIYIPVISLVVGKKVEDCCEYRKRLVNVSSNLHSRRNGPTK